MRTLFLMFSSFLILGCGAGALPEPTPVINETPSPTERPVSILEVTDFSYDYPILMFHHVEEVSESHPDKVFYGLSFSPAKLESFLVYFQENNITTLSFADLTEIKKGRKEAPDRAVMLTFDDGYTNNFNMALPLLEKYNMVGNFGIISDKVGSTGFYMNADQVKTLSQTQHICSHTVTHPALSEISDEKLEIELKSSQKFLQELTGQPVKCLIYPAGKYNENVMAKTAKFYDWARTTENGIGISASKRFKLPTKRIFPKSGIASLRGWIE